MALVGVKHEPVGLDLNNVCFDEERDIPNTRKNQEKVEGLLNGVDVGNVE